MSTNNFWENYTEICFVALSITLARQGTSLLDVREITQINTSKF
jgi:hypothetical protein